MKYFLDSKYTSITGEYFVKGNKIGTLNFKIIADGVVVYESGAIDRTAKLTEFNLDVTNVSELTFESDIMEYNGAGSEPTLYMTNVILERKLSDNDLKM